MLLFLAFDLPICIFIYVINLYTDLACLAAGISRVMRRSGEVAGGVLLFWWRSREGIGEESSFSPLRRQLKRRLRCQ